MMWYQVIEICNLEPLKIGSGGSKEHWEEPCKDYIPGSTLRGGAIARMRRKGLFDDDPKAILQHMECFNAYLYRNGQLYIPAPQHLRMDKHEYRRQKSMSGQEGSSMAAVQLTNLFAAGQGSQAGENNNPASKDALPDPFVTIRGEYLEGARPSKSYRLHHSSMLNRELQERANLFSYQALEPGQSFRAVMAYSERIKQRVEEMWSDSDIWYLGGSKGSGYGRCRVQALGEACADYAQARQQLGIPAPAYAASGFGFGTAPALTLTCLSDMIIRGQYGEPLPCLPEQWLEDCCGIKLRRRTEGQGHFVQTGVTEGYNATWRARYPKETTIKAGSVMRYELEGQPDEQLLRQVAALLEQRRFGARTQDGYGWIAVNIPYPSSLQIYSESPQMEKEQPSRSDRKAAPPAHIAESIRLISKGLADARIRWLRMLAQRLPGTEDAAGALIIHKLKSHHCRIMQNELEEWLRAGGKPEEGLQKDKPDFLDRDYCQDRKYCSLAGVHFNGIISYLRGDSQVAEHEALRRFAENMLNSSHGRIYYGDTGASSGNSPEIRQKRFIAELLREGLYIRQKSAQKEEASNED
ncbi:hypothetical protein [Paenibacillus sp. YN15]|uniref:hypothetical protein n=1 Tax=Paenibacillus sp. YN15 TaxID=1742774 RepID=UPI000DCBEB00|nr:hypothetical protein [Paenibacillus sp. YN15]RAU94351.1 hypothetical protein DQG13_24185 [Paenibacillus sp. YN15]